MTLTLLLLGTAVWSLEIQAADQNVVVVLDDSGSMDSGEVDDRVAAIPAGAYRMPAEASHSPLGSGGLMGAVARAGDGAEVGGRHDHQGSPARLRCRGCRGGECLRTWGKRCAT